RASFRRALLFLSFFFPAPAPTAIYTLSLHDALPICGRARTRDGGLYEPRQGERASATAVAPQSLLHLRQLRRARGGGRKRAAPAHLEDRAVWPQHQSRRPNRSGPQIGRASCRERV